MSDIAKAYVQIIPSAEGIQGSLTKLFAGEAQSAGKTAGSGIGGGIMKTLAGLGIAKAITDSVTSVFKTGAEFDSAMSQVAATMGKSVDEISNLRDTAKEMGATTSFTATQAAEGLNYLALAGYTTEQQMAALPTVLNLAAAGAMDLGSASDMVTDAMSALGVEVTQDNLTDFADVLAKTSSTTNTSVAQLGEALLTVGGTAKGLSGGVNEAAQVLGLLANNGIKASEGGTHLRNIMLAMNPTTDKAIAAWEKLGVSAYDAETGALRPLEDTFKDLGEAMEGMTDQEKTDTLTKMFNKTDLSAVNALLDTNAKEWEKVGTAIEESGGAAEEMAKTQLDNVNGSLTLMGSALDGLKLSLWDTFKDAAKGAIDGFTGIIGSAQGFIDEHSEEIKTVINGIGTAFSGVWDGIQSTFSWVVEQINTDGTTFNGIFERGQEIVETLGGVWNTVTGEITGLMTSLREQAETEGTPLNTAIQAIGTAFEDVKGVVDTVVSSLIGFWNDLTTSSEDNSSTISSAFELVQTAVNTACTLISTGIGLVRTILQNLGIDSESVKETVSGAFELLHSSIDGTIGLINGLLEGVIQLLNGDFSGAWTTIKSTVEEAWTGAKEALEESPLGPIIDTVTDAINGVISAAGGVVGAIVGAFQDAYNTVVGWIDKIKGKISELAQALAGLNPFASGNLPDVSVTLDAMGNVVPHASNYDTPMLMDSNTIFGRSGNNFHLAGDRGAYKGGELVYSHDNLMADIADASGSARVDELIVLFGEFMDKFGRMGMYMNGQLVGAIGPGMRSYNERADLIGGW